jgi:hypothetical protein
MGRLSIISVTGAVPHSACYFDYDGSFAPKAWLGFGPSKHRSPATTHGKVFTDDESYRENHGIIFRVNDTVMHAAAEKAVEKYSTGPYVVTVRDCVSFSADVARWCNLNVPVINMTPYGLILILAVWNDYEKRW